MEPGRQPLPAHDGNQTHALGHGRINADRGEADFQVKDSL